MTDTTSATPVPMGQGKALASGVTSFISVLVAVFLREHYTDLFSQIEAAGYPLPLIIATIAGLISHITTWFTSVNIVGIVISWIMALKKIKKVWNDPS